MLPVKPTSLEEEKLGKILANRGVCSRREAASYIEAGRVKVDGMVVTNKAMRILPDVEIRVDNKVILPPSKIVLYAFHKPKSVLTTHRDPQGRQTLFDILPQKLMNCVTVGRLDYNSEGLILLTNHRGFKRYLELPTTALARIYRVRAYGIYNPKPIALLSKGVEIEGVRYKPIQVVHDSSKGQNHWLTVTLKEGKNREIRKVLEYAGLEVNRLIRTAYGPFTLDKLPIGEVTIIPKRQLDPVTQRFFQSEA